MVLCTMCRSLSSLLKPSSQSLDGAWLLKTWVWATRNTPFGCMIFSQQWWNGSPGWTGGQHDDDDLLEEATGIYQQVFDRQCCFFTVWTVSILSLDAAYQSLNTPTKLRQTNTLLPHSKSIHPHWRITAFLSLVLSRKPSLPWPNRHLVCPALKWWRETESL